MLFPKHPPADLSKGVEFFGFARQQRISLEMRDNFLNQIWDASNLVFQGSIRSIGPNPTAAEGLLKQVQYLRAIVILADRKTWPDIPAEGMALTAIECHTKASFAVHISRQIPAYIRRFQRNPVLNYRFWRTASLRGSGLPRLVSQPNSIASLVILLYQKD